MSKIIRIVMDPPRVEVLKKSNRQVNQRKVVAFMDDGTMAQCWLDMPTDKYDKVTDYARWKACSKIMQHYGLDQTELLHNIEGTIDLTAPSEGMMLEASIYMSGSRFARLDLVKTAEPLEDKKEKVYSVGVKKGEKVTIVVTGV